jgi:hypothetical protein
MITSFKSFLIEAARETGKASDAEGKLHELLTGMHFNKGKHVESYREEGQLPEDIHNKLKDEVSPETYDRISTHAKEMAGHLHNFIKSSGFKGKVDKTAWTSQTKDIEHFTGKKDPNNESDLMTTLVHGAGSTKPKGTVEHLGFSMKYANNAPTLKNKTPKTLSDTYGVDHTKLANPHEGHMAAVRKVLGASKTTSAAEMHTRYKALRGTDVGDAIEKSSHSSRVEMINTLHKHLSKMTPSELHKQVLNHIAGPTNTKVLMASTNSEGKHSIIDTREHYNKILADHKDELSVKKGEGTTMSITGKGGKPLLNIQAVNKGRPTKTPEFIAKPGASLLKH